MTPQELLRLIRKSEGLKLDFKREYKLQSKSPEGVERQSWNQFVAGQWDELIKDVLALTNGNFGTIKEPGILIIGVDDQLGPNGSRQLYDSSYLTINSQQILTRVNGSCYPPVPDLSCEFVELDGYKICVISIPPSPYVHETTRQLEITKGEFDANGKLRALIKPPKTYTAHTAFVRRGEDIFPATNAERRKLEEEKSLLLSSGVNGNNDKNKDRKSVKTQNPKAKVEKKLQICVLEPLTDKYAIFKIGVAAQIIWGISILFLTLLALGDFPAEITIVLLLPSLILLAYFCVVYISLKDSAAESGFYKELRLLDQRREVRGNLRKIARSDRRFPDKQLYFVYIVCLLHLILPVRKIGYWF